MRQPYWKKKLYAPHSQRSAESSSPILSRARCLVFLFAFCVIHKSCVKGGKERARITASPGRVELSETAVALQTVAANWLPRDVVVSLDRSKTSQQSYHCHHHHHHHHQQQHHGAGVCVAKNSGNEVFLPSNTISNGGGNTSNLGQQVGTGTQTNARLGVQKGSPGVLVRCCVGCCFTWPSLVAYVYELCIGEFP